MFYGHKRFERSIQVDDYSCGAHVVFMTLRHYGKRVTYRNVKAALGTTKDGTETSAMRRVLRAHGLKVQQRIATTKRDLRKCLKSGGVAVAYMDGDHVAVVHGMRENGTVYVADPSLYRAPWRKHSPAKFKARWDQWALVVHPA